MCLLPTHKNAFIATQDIYCYKVLTNHNSILLTPFQSEVIVFKNGIAIQETDNFGYGSSGKIFEGIHSYQKHFDLLYGRFYYSIIPKGTQYYIGDIDDLVSLKLIIFKNRFRYWKYKIFHK